MSNYKYLKYLAASFIALTLLAACQPQSTDRQGKLLTMAGEEAASIKSTLDRFGRQLNIANIQLQSGRTADADKMLLLARDTLTASAKTDLDDFHRIAGWTAIAQLALRASDRDLATKSAQSALESLNDVAAVPQRAEYVISLAWVLAEVRGKDSAIELINSGGAWAGEITNLATRRQALMAFASQLLNYDAFDNARTLLRHDPDPAWRTDAMLTLAQPSISDYMNMRSGLAVGAMSSGGRGGGAGGGPMAPTMAENKMYDQSATPASATYGKDIRFESVFQHPQN